VSWNWASLLSTSITRVISKVWCKASSNQQLQTCCYRTLIQQTSRGKIIIKNDGHYLRITFSFLHLNRPFLVCCLTNNTTAYSIMWPCSNDSSREEWGYAKHKNMLLVAPITSLDSCDSKAMSYSIIWLDYSNSAVDFTSFWGNVLKRLARNCDNGKHTFTTALGSVVSRWC
jgi:hypothetical protein